MVLIFIPLALAFANTGMQVWKFIIDLMISVLFLVDMILSFFTAYYDKRNVIIVDDYKVTKEYF